MNLCSVILEDRKATVKNVVGILSLLCVVLMLPVSVEARDYHIRASDGTLYTVTLGENSSVENFSVQKSNGEILRGVTDEERAIATELYFASKLFSTVLPFYSPNAEEVDWEELVKNIADDALKKLNQRQIATIVGKHSSTMLLIIGTGSFSLPLAVLSEINGAIANELEKRLLLDAAFLAIASAARVSKHERVLRDLWLSYETQSAEISINEINAAWESFYKLACYQSLAAELVYRYLDVPDLKERLGTFFRSIVPFAQDVETLKSIMYSDRHIQRLRDLNNNGRTEIHEKVLSDIDKNKKQFRAALEQAGFFQPMKVGQLEDIRISEDDLPQRLDVREYFSPDSGSLTYIARSKDLSVAVAAVERSGSSVMVITPKGVGSTSVVVDLINFRGLSVTQSFTVTVGRVTQQNQKPEPVGTIPPQILTVEGSSETVDTAPYFSSQNNLMYEVASNPRGIVMERISDSRVTIIPIQAGIATVVVTAFDRNDRSLYAIQTIAVIVRSERAPIVITPDPIFTPSATSNPSVAGLREGVSVIVQNLGTGVTLRIRTGPGLDNDIIELIGNGITGTITDGPRRNDGYTWWRIEWDALGLEGWSVEADRGQILFRRPPDLEIQDLDVSDDEVAPGEAFEIEVRVRNNGPGESAATELYVYYSPNRHSDLTELGAESNLRVAGRGTLKVPSLRSGRSRELSLSVEAPMTPDNYYYGALLPSNIHETDYTLDLDPDVLLNNFAREERVKVTSSPDLIVDSISVRNGKVTLDPGEEFTLEATVRNQGLGEPRSDARLRYHRSSDPHISDNDTEVGDDTVSRGNLDTGDTEEESIRLTAPSTPGIYYYGGCVDLRYESNTGNNCSAAVAITVRDPAPDQTPDLPDLVPGVPTVSANSLAPGQSFTLETIVQNRGAGGSRDTTLRWYLSPNSNISTNDTEVGSSRVSSLDAGETETQQFSLDAPVAAGIYYYGVYIESVADESNTANNYSTGVVLTVQNLAPVAANTLPAQTLFVGSASVVNVAPYFSDPNQDALTYKALSKLPKVVTVEMSGLSDSYLRMNPLAEGIATVTVTASDGTLTATQRIMVTVEAAPRVTHTLEKISGDNQQGPAGAILENPFIVEVRDAANRGLEAIDVMFAVIAGEGTLSETTVTTNANGQASSWLTLGSQPGTNIVHASVEGISQTVIFNAVTKSMAFDFSVPSGISLIHVPLKVTAVDGAAKTIISIADLYNALGGADTVNFLATYDSVLQKWLTYTATADTGTFVDKGLTDDTGIIAGMQVPVTVRLRGNALGTNERSTITLNPGFNLVGLPLRDERITHVSDLFTLDGIRGNVPVIILSDNGEFKTVGHAGDPGDIEITGGQAFILNAQQAATVTLSGDGWTNVSGAAAAPLVGNADAVPSILASRDLHSLLTTPVLALRGSIVDEETHLKVEGLKVTVKNFSTGRAVAAVSASNEAGYRITVVDIEAGRAAQIGDILEISAQSSNPFIGVEPLRYTVTSEDVKQSLIQLPNLVAYEIPTETKLLRNYPNPFNPETWIPYRLAEDALVTLTIYDLSGQIVRTLNVGHRVAAVYENRSKAIYWDGKNEIGEQVASGVYFYHLSAGGYSDTRKMLVIK